MLRSPAAVCWCAGLNGEPLHVFAMWKTLIQKNRAYVCCCGESCEHEGLEWRLDEGKPLNGAAL